MSMFDDVLGFGRTSIMESMSDDALEPEIAGMTLEEAADIDEDPMDFMLRVAYENEMNMMNLNAAIIAEEYIYLRENGEEMVTEAGKIESIISRAKQMIMSLWNKIQSFFKAVLKKIDEALHLDKRFLDKYKAKAVKYSAKVKGDAGYLAIEAIGDTGVAMLDGLADLGTTIYDRIRRDENAKNTDVDTVNKIIMKVMGANNKEGIETPKDIMKAMLKKNKESDEMVTIAGKDAVDAFEKSAKVKEKLKKAYDTNKKGINNQLKTVKKMESVAKKFKVIPTDESRYIHVTVKSLNKIGSYMTLVNRTYVKLINRCRSFYKAVIISAAAKADSGDKKAKNESTSLIEAFELL